MPRLLRRRVSRPEKVETRKLYKQRDQAREYAKTLKKEIRRQTDGNSHSGDKNYRRMSKLKTLDMDATGSRLTGRLRRHSLGIKETWQEIHAIGDGETKTVQKTGVRGLRKQDKLVQSYNAAAKGLETTDNNIKTAKKIDKRNQYVFARELTLSNQGATARADKARRRKTGTKGYRMNLTGNKAGTARAGLGIA